MPDPIKPAHPAPPLVVAKTAQERHADGKAERLEKAAQIHKELEAILKDYDYKESEIPHSSAYWDLLNQYRTLKNS